MERNLLLTEVQSTVGKQSLGLVVDEDFCRGGEKMVSALLHIVLNSGHIFFIILVILMAFAFLAL